MKNKFIIKVILLWLCSLSVMCTGVVSPALPIIKKHFTNIPNSVMLVKMMAVAPNFFIAFFSPFFGYFAHKIGKIRLLIFALLLYGVAGSAGAYLPTLHHIIISRALLGIAIAAVNTIAITLIADYFEGSERTTLIGMQTTFMSIGSIVYAMLSGVIADVNWRAIFYMYLLSVFVLPLVMMFLFEPHKHKHRSQESKTEKKVVQNNIAVILVCMLVLITMAMFYTIWLQVPFLLSNDSVFAKYAINAKKTAIATSFEVLLAAIVSMRYKKIKKNRDFAVMGALSFFIMSISYLVMYSSKTYYEVILATSICGIGMGLMMPNNTLWIISITKAETRPFFMGLFVTSTFLGKFLSPIIASAIIKLTSNRLVFVVDACIMIFVAILGMYLNDYFKRINRIKYRNQLKLAKEMGLVDENY